MRVKTERMEQAERMNVTGGVVMAWDKGVDEDWGITGWTGRACPEGEGQGQGQGQCDRDGNGNSSDEPLSEDE